MIIPEVTSKPIDRIAIGQEHKFKIKPSAKAFRILSSTLYPDVIGSPLRELATNAADSHRDAGVTEPFLIHLPNALEPYFSIRDYGTGISEENIGNVYCTYFESTRTDSNNFTGGFGLGSKTPFCYSDTFTVISYYNGRKMIYTAFLEDGEPKIAKFADDETDERNGLEVSFPVKRDDISTFVSTAKRIYSRFVDKPKVVGNSDFKLDDVTYSIKGKGWGIREHKSNNRYQTESSVVIMGNIGYPIDSSKINAKSESIRQLLYSGVEIEFNVGDLQPTVSREHLQYDVESIDKINRRLDEICVELVSKIQSDISSAPNLYAARLLYKNIFNKSSSYGSNIESICRYISIKYNNITISDNIDIKKVFIEHFKIINCIYPTFSLRYYEEPHISLSTVVKSNKVLNFYVSDDIEFYVNDLKSGHTGRIRQYIKNNKKQIYLIEDEIYNNKQLLNKIFDVIGLDVGVIKKTSSLDKVPTKPRIKTQKSDIRQLLVYTTQYSRDCNSWCHKNIDISKDNHYYVDINVHTPEHVSIGILHKLISFVANITKTTPEIVGIRSDCRKQVKSLSNWIEFLPYAKKIIQDYINTNNLSQTIVNSMTYSSHKNNSCKFVESPIKSSELDNNSLIFDYLCHVEYMNNEYNKTINHWISDIEILNQVGINLTSFVATYDLSKERCEIVDKYKLLNYIVPHGELWRVIKSDGWKPALISYLNSIKKV